MDIKVQRNMDKWEDEINFLESVKESFKKYQELRNENAKKEELTKVSDKVAKVFGDHNWIKMDWKEVRADKKSIETGIKKIDEKIHTRKKKITKAEEAEPPVVEMPKPKPTVIEEPGRDWTPEIEACKVETILYHWAYGEMKVVAIEGDYIYMRLNNKKGCKHQWMSRNNMTIDVNGKEETVKEFSIYSIGRWLFPDISDVEVINFEDAHSMFA